MHEKKARNDRRLVLGEREAVLRETREFGGIYIDLHPEAFRKLQAAKIDPFLIYERALLEQIEEKIPQIDFVQADVEQLFQEWKSKPQEGIPMHARLVLWLKDNADAYNYEQSGNSWILRK